jgi:nucleoside 2-deoxyribosyltransferase
MKLLRPLENLRRVYCAGPLFNAAERREMTDIARALQAGGFETFVPHSDGLEFSQVLPYLQQQGCDHGAAGRLLHEAIFALDVYHVLVGCGSLVFNMNGRIPDEGGVAEMSMAWMLGKPIVIYKEDVRSKIAGRDNPLVVGQTGFLTISSMSQLAPALSAKIGALVAPLDWQTPCPPHLTETLLAGETFWRRIQSLGAERPADLLGDWMLELFASRIDVSASPALS